jgi:hypothetical protein
MRRLFFLVLMIALAGAAWTNRERLRPFWEAAAARWQTLRADPAAADATRDRATAELAQQAQSKLDAVRSGEQTQASFTTDELQSLLVYKYRQLLPAFVDSPNVALEGDRIRLRMRVPVDRLPSVNELGEVGALLPDTAELDVRGQLLPSAEGQLAFAVDAVSAHRIPLPRRLVPSALEMLGRRDSPGLPADAILVPLPKGARAAYVRGDSLVLLSQSPASPRN